MRNAAGHYFGVDTAMKEDVAKHIIFESTEMNKSAGWHCIGVDSTMMKRNK